MRQTGTVKFFNTAKGFGFITPEAARRTCSSTSRRPGACRRSRSLNEGQKVTFEAEQDKRGRGLQELTLSSPDQPFSGLNLKQRNAEGAALCLPVPAVNSEMDCSAVPCLAVGGVRARTGTLRHRPSE